MIDKFFDMKITPYTWDNIYKPAFEEVLDFFEFDPFADDSAANKRPNIVTHKSMRTLQSKTYNDSIYLRLTFINSNANCIQSYF